MLVNTCQAALKRANMMSIIAVFDDESVYFNNIFVSKTAGSIDQISFCYILGDQRMRLLNVLAVCQEI